MPTPTTTCAVCRQKIAVPGYGVARHLDSDGGPHECPPPAIPVYQGLAEPPQAVSETLTAESYSQGVDGKWRRAKGSRGKGGIVL